MDPSQQPDTVEEGEISLDVTEQPPDTSTVQSVECITVASGKRYSRWDLDTEDTDEETQASRSKRQRRSKKQKATGADAAATSSPTTAQTEPDTANATPPVRPYRRPRPIPPLIRPCGSVDRYERLNRIDEGSYGVVYRGRDRVTGEIVALKRLKCEHQDRNGFPITDLREIHSLLWIKHENIVNVREIVVGGGHPPKVFIVMDFLEHDLKTLMSDMTSPFMQSEVKTLMLQLLSAVATLHRNWIVHRDLKTSNLLLNNRGRVKVADFGLARKFGSPLHPMTVPVVTLWYRAPELLLGSKEYTTAVDMWSVGCIFGELLLKEPLMPGRGEIDQINLMFKLLGTPNEEIWPGFSELPSAKTLNFTQQPYNMLRSKFKYATANTIDLLSRLLTYDPKQRITAEEALRHPYFSEQPAPQHPDLFPSWPSKASKERSGTLASPVLVVPKADMG